MPTKSYSSEWTLKDHRMLLVVKQQQVGLSGESEMVGKSGDLKPFVSLSMCQGHAEWEQSDLEWGGITLE